MAGSLKKRSITEGAAPGSFMVMRNQNMDKP